MSEVIEKKPRKSQVSQKPKNVVITQEMRMRAEELYQRHLDACVKHGIDPDPKESFVKLTSIDLQYLSDLKNYEYDKSNISEGLTEQRYRVYETPRVESQRVFTGERYVRKRKQSGVQS